MCVCVCLCVCVCVPVSLGQLCISPRNVTYKADSSLPCLPHHYLEAPYGHFLPRLLCSCHPTSSAYTLTSITCYFHDILALFAPLHVHMDLN